MTLARFDYREPETLAEAVALLGEYGDEAMVIAGGLTVVILLRERLVRPAVLVSLSALQGLQGIAVNGGCRVGAMVTHREIERSAEIRAAAPLLGQACRRVGSPVIRNMGTLGGNVCQADAASDPIPALLALEAQAVIAGPGGERRLPLTDFYKGLLATDLGEGELLVALEIPAPPAGACSRYIKYTCTSEEAFPAVSVAILAVPGEGGTCRDVRIGLGNVAPTATRAGAAEALLRGQAVSEERIAEAAEAAAAGTDPSSDGQGSADYRREMTRVWVRRALEGLLLS
jgi:carbon-monoxide dehydrogenase medium subunit